MQQLNRQSGSALIYAIVAIALLGILTYTLSKGGNEQGSQKKQTQLIAELSSQIDFITSATQECVVNYPNQDSELTSTEQKNKPYPIMPSDPYFTNQGASPGSTNTGSVEDVAVKNIRCPGNPGGISPKNQDHAMIFTSSTGKFFPPQPNLFDQWYYYTGTDGVFFFIGTSKGDTYISPALTKLDAKYAPCETDFIDATGGRIYLSTDTPRGFSVRFYCELGYRCFRYWVIRKPSAIPSETGCN